MHSKHTPEKKLHIKNKQNGNEMEIIMLYEKVREDLKKTMKERDTEKLSALRVIVGEFPRLNKKAGENPTNEEVLKIMRKLQKSEKIVLEKQDQQSSVFLEVVNSYLPKMMTVNQIKEFILANLPNIEKEENKMRYMGDIMRVLSGKADGGLVRKILSEI